MGDQGVKLFGTLASRSSLRVEWALKLKGVEYEYLNEEDVYHNKSPELLHYNPITKKVPTLVHNGRAVFESLVILEYIDEAWSDAHPIMPKDPYELAQARFWAKFVEDKCHPASYAVFCTVGEELQKAVHELQEILRTLEKALVGKTFFGGDTIGYLDIVTGWMPNLLRMVEELAGVSVVNDESLPLLNAWFQRFLDVEVIRESLPPKDKLYDTNRKRRDQLLTGQIPKRY